MCVVYDNLPFKDHGKWTGVLEALFRRKQIIIYCANLVYMFKNKFRIFVFARSSLLSVYLEGSQILGFLQAPQLMFCKFLNNFTVLYRSFYYFKFFKK